MAADVEPVHAAPIDQFESGSRDSSHGLASNAGWSELTVGARAAIARLGVVDLRCSDAQYAVDRRPQTPSRDLGRVALVRARVGVHTYRVPPWTRRSIVRDGDGTLMRLIATAIRH